MRSRFHSIGRSVAMAFAVVAAVSAWLPFVGAESTGATPLRPPPSPTWS